jgi:hypothetical protein
MRMHSKSGIVNGLFPDRNRLVVKKVFQLPYDHDHDGPRLGSKAMAVLLHHNI